MIPESLTYTQPNQATERGRLISELSPVGFVFLQAARTTDKQENWLGVSSDKLNRIQLVGPEDALVRVTVVCTQPERGDSSIGQYQGKLIIVLTTLVVPSEPSLPDRIGDRIRQLRKAPVQIINWGKGQRTIVSVNKHERFISVQHNLRKASR